MRIGHNIMDTLDLTIMEVGAGACGIGHKIMDTLDLTIMEVGTGELDKIL